MSSLTWVVTLVVRLFRIEPAYRGLFIERINRFVVRVKVGSEVVLAHNTNTGRLSEFLSPGKSVLLVPIESKMRYRLVGVEDSVVGCYGIVDILTQARAFEKSVEQGLISYLEGCQVIARNPAVGGSRLDYKLLCGPREVFIETKSAVMRGPEGEAMYPDCETSRGKKHLKTLIELASTGRLVYLIFISAMCSVRCFRPNREGDREVPQLVRKAAAAGVTVKSISLHMDADGVVYLENPDVYVCLGD